MFRIPKISRRMSIALGIFFSSLFINLIVGLTAINKSEIKVVISLPEVIAIIFILNLFIAAVPILVFNILTGSEKQE